MVLAASASRMVSENATAQPRGGDHGGDRPFHAAGHRIGFLIAPCGEDELVGGQCSPDP
jgi:hypothetical protein